MDMRILLRGIGVGLIAASVAFAATRLISDIQQGNPVLWMGTETPAAGINAPETKTPDTDTSAPAATETPAVTEIPAATETPAAAQTANPPAASTPGKAETAQPAPTPAAESSGEKMGDQKVYTLEIKAGMESYHVARALAAAGVVEDTASFSKYLASMPIAENLQVGTYQIPYGASQEEIVQILSGKVTAQDILDKYKK